MDLRRLSDLLCALEDFQVFYGRRRYILGIYRKGRASDFLWKLKIFWSSSSSVKKVLPDYFWASCGYMILFLSRNIPLLGPLSFTISILNSWERNHFCSDSDNGPINWGDKLSILLLFWVNLWHDFLSHPGDHLGENFSFDFLVGVRHYISQMKAKEAAKGDDATALRTRWSCHRLWHCVRGVGVVSGKCLSPMILIITQNAREVLELQTHTGMRLTHS